YSIKGYFIPEASRTAKGLPLVNILTFQEDEKLAAVTAVPNLEDDNLYLFFATKKGIVKRTRLSQFKNIRTNGIIAINLQENDELLQVSLTDGNRGIILGSSHGKAIHFKESDVRPIGRSAAGVKGIALAKKDYLVGMAIVTDEKNEVLIVTEKGYGKRSTAEEYRVQGRGGMGVKAFNVTAKNGKLVALRSVNPNLDLIITTDKGVIIRMHIDKISLAGRNTQGVILIKLKGDQSIANTAIVDRQPDEDEQILETPTPTVAPSENETIPTEEQSTIEE
ncbi:MAG: DNA gyrase subunit A, partial [Anaeroplasmataceae bacterium]|nr:DNA gyrase subunit A [Anaeroplasmataceae bacterium]